MATTGQEKKVIPVNLLNAPPRDDATTEVRPLWSLGFRPFFIAAAVFAAAFVPLWLFIWMGWVDVGAYLSGPLWHGHEMVYGFTFAVIAGFLLTAASNWTRRKTAVGRALIGLVALWVAGRVAMLFAASLPALLVATVDVLFVPALAVALGRALIPAGNRRNYVFLVLLGLFTLANVAMHAEALGWWVGIGRPALLFSVDLVILVILVIGGRVIPMFTRNATGLSGIDTNRFVDRATLASMAVTAVVPLVAPMSVMSGVLAAATGLLVFLRMRNWGTRATWKSPILWVLHIGHAWIGVGLLLRATSELGWLLAGSAATHVLTIGAIGTLTLGMMSRVSLGHTGRPLHVSSSVAFSFVLVTLAVIARGLFPVVAPATAMWAYGFSGFLWSLAFIIFLIRYGPILVRPRADAR